MTDNMKEMGKASRQEKELYQIQTTPFAIRPGIPIQAAVGATARSPSTLQYTLSLTSSRLLQLPNSAVLGMDSYLIYYANEVSLSIRFSETAQRHGPLKCY